MEAVAMCLAAITEWHIRNALVEFVSPREQLSSPLRIFVQLRQDLSA
jgi:hypothetical protein